MSDVSLGAYLQDCGVKGLVEKQYISTTTPINTYMAQPAESAFANGALGSQFVADPDAGNQTEGWWDDMWDYWGRKVSDWTLENIER